MYTLAKLGHTLRSLGIYWIARDYFSTLSVCPATNTTKLLSSWEVRLTRDFTISKWKIIVLQEQMTTVNTGEGHVTVGRDFSGD